MAKYTDNLLGDQQLRLTLDRYQEIMQLPIAAFNGLNWPDEDPKVECSTIWSQANRDNLALWIAAAEERREQELGYHLAPIWITDEEHNYNNGTVILDKKLLVEVGSPTYSVVGDSVAITHRDGGSNIIDPVEVSVDVGAVVDTNDIIVRYEDTSTDIRPSSVTIAGTVITVKIPRSRLVKPEVMDNRQDHLYYVDDDNFVDAVDIILESVTLDGSVTFVWSNSQITCPAGCSEVTQPGCYTTHGHRAKRISKAQVWPASYTDDVPSGAIFKYPCRPWAVRVSYLSGRQNSMNTELLTARLAHTMMPAEPCSCAYVEQYWKEDRVQTEYMSGYGSMQGAINAWNADFRHRIGAGGMLK